MAQGVRKPWYNFRVIDHRRGGTHRRNKEGSIGRVFIGLASGRRTWFWKEDLKGSRIQIKRRLTEKACSFFMKYWLKNLVLRSDDNDFVSP